MNPGLAIAVAGCVGCFALLIWAAFNPEIIADWISSGPEQDMEG